MSTFADKTHMAKLEFRYGVMSSGKSAYLLQTAYNYEVSGRKVTVIKPKVDVKSGSYISSRLGIERKIDFFVKTSTDIFEQISIIDSKLLEQTGQHLAALLVDEAQFLSKEHVNQLLKIATFLNIPVLCFGIRTDFLTEGFEGSNRLLQIAHSIEEMKTICAQCGEHKATLNVRKKGENYIFEGKQVAIDKTLVDSKTQITYESLCSKCYLKARKGHLNSD